MTNRRQRGFTLIELMIVVTIIGILTSIAIAGVGAVRAKAHYAAMKSDLHRVIMMEEAFWDSRLGHRRGPRYGNYRQLQRQLNFSPSPGVRIRIRARRNGWSARANHSALGRRERCAVYFGQVRPHRPAAKPGVIACE